MKQRRKVVPIICLLVLCSVTLGAAEPLTLEQARANALAGSRTLRKALLSVDAALLAQKIQGYAVLPSLAASAALSASYPAPSLADSLAGSLGLSVSQVLYEGGRNRLLSAIDAVATRAAREQARAEYFEVLSNVDGAYFSALEAGAAVEAAHSDLEAARSHLDLARAKLEAGMITRYACLQSEAESAAKETALVQAWGRRSVAESRLAGLTGLPLPLELAGPDLEALERITQRLARLEGAGVFIDSLTGAASANNPSVAAARLAGEQARLSVDLAGAQYLPSLSAGYRHGVSLRAGQELDSGSGSVSLAASIPLDFWTTRANAQVKKTAAQQATLDGEETWANLELEIQAAAYDCISSARAVISARKALEYAEGHYQGVLELYGLASASSGELSDAQALVSANRTALISARYSLLSNLSSLRVLAALESDEELADLIP